MATELVVAEWIDRDEHSGRRVRRPAIRWDAGCRWLRVACAVGVAWFATACQTTAWKPAWADAEFTVESGAERSDASSMILGLRAADATTPLLPEAMSAWAAARALPAAGALTAAGADGAGDGQGEVAGEGQGAGEGADPPEGASERQGKTLGEAERGELRSRFGSTILIGDDGRVTKQYFLSGEAGPVFLRLLDQAGVPPPKDRTVVDVGGEARPRSILGRMLGPEAVELLYIPSFELPEGVPIRRLTKSGNAAPNGLAVTSFKAEAGNNLLLVTATPTALGVFEKALNLFYSNIPQVEIEVKVVEYQTSNSLSIGLTDQTGPTIEPTSSDKLIKSYSGQFPLTPPLIGPAPDTQGTIALGGIHDALELDAQLDLLETRGIADILSSPRMSVRNGGLAWVATITEIPYPDAQIFNSGANVSANVSFRPVGVRLHIRPVIAGTDTVILHVFASVSAVTSFTGTRPLLTPIISSREVVTTVHVDDGKTTVIGGLVANSTFDQVSKVPLLGDIPLLGLLFRSTSVESSETTLEFHITPRIVQGPRGFDGG